MKLHNPFHFLTLASVPLLLACPPKANEEDSGLGGDVDSNTDTDTDTDTDDTDTGDTDSPTAGETTALVATVSDDYTTGTLATVSLSNWTVTDEITTIAADPGLSVDDGYAFIVGRYGYDYVRVYEPGTWDEPILEISTGSNPYDVHVCEDKMFVSLYGESYISVYDMESGLVTGAVDLSTYDPGDGTPDMGNMVESNGKLYTGIGRFDSSWTSQGGYVLEIDCASETVTNEWEAGLNTAVSAWPADPTKVLVQTGEYYDSTDGSLMVLDTTTGTLGEPIVSENDLGEDLAAVGAGKNNAFVITMDDSYGYHMYCVDLKSNEATEVESTNSYISSMTVNDAGEAWIVARPGWADSTSTSGVIVYDIDTCSSLTGSDWLSTILSPSSVAFY